jgi:4-amino-4-deoxy-L-arabinose transferase-like glycosyltransferase
MIDQTTANHSHSSLIRLWPWLVLLLLLLFVGFIRFRLLDMPLERDEGEYAYAGQLILQGIPPYELAYNMKLPGTYIAYALGMMVFGQTIVGVHLTLIVANSLTIIFIFLLGRKLFDVTSGLVACATYAVLSVSPAVMGMAAHANHFVVLFAVPATLLLWKAAESNRNATPFFSGLLYGLAFLMKQQGISFCLFGWAVLVWWAMQDKTLFSSAFGRKCFCFGLGMILPFVGACLLLAAAGLFSKFWFWTFTYAGSYINAESARVGIENLAAYFQKKGIIYIGFVGLIILGTPAIMRGKTKARQIHFVSALFVFSCLGAATGLYFREHYFILLLPAFAIAVGLAVASMQKYLETKFPRKLAGIVPLMLFVMVLGWNISFQKQLFFRWPANWVCSIIYGLDPFLETPVIAEYIRSHSSTNTRIAVIGSEPEIYFYAHRHSATGYLYTYPLMEKQPYALKMQADMIGEIESSQPEYLVWIGYPDSWNVRPDSDRAILDWFPKYAEKFYTIVGVYDGRAADKAVFLWDNGAKNYRGDSSLVVYKRKTS